MDFTLLIVPGLGDSGKGHWQNYWLNQFGNARKVIQKDWDNPILEDWLIELSQSIDSIDGPIIIVAHSLAVSLVAHYSQNNKNPKIAAALLVAPADVDSPLHTPEVIWNFSPIPLTRLNYPSMVVTSSNDPYISVERAQFLAKQWESSFINVGQKGHLNSESKLEYWEEGQELVKTLLLEIKKRS